MRLTNDCWKRLLLKQFQVDGKLHIGSVVRDLIFHTVHERPHQEHSPPACLQQVLLLQGIGDGLGLEPFPFIYDMNHERIVAHRADDRYLFLRIGLVAMKDSVVNGFGGRNQQTVEGPIIDTGRFVDLQEKRFHLSDFLWIASNLNPGDSGGGFSGRVGNSFRGRLPPE